MSSLFSRATVNCYDYQRRVLKSIAAREGRSLIDVLDDILYHGAVKLDYGGIVDELYNNESVKAFRRRYKK